MTNEEIIDLFKSDEFHFNEGYRYEDDNLYSLRPHKKLSNIVQKYYGIQNSILYDGNKIIATLKDHKVYREGVQIYPEVANGI